MINSGREWDWMIHKNVLEMSDKELYKIGWWVSISPLAKIKPSEFIVGVYKRGNKSWITEICKSGFDNPFDARKWAGEFITKHYTENETQN